jgi:TonB family protein
VNERHPGERRVRLIALCLCGAVYLVAAGLVFRGLEEEPQQRTPVVSSMTLSFVQVELQAPAAPEPEPQPQPELLPEPVDADVAPEKAEEVPEPLSEPEPEPMPESDAPVAQVTQQASAPVLLVSADELQGWVIGRIEREKYYPPAAERLGLRGTFDLSVTVDDSGTIRMAEVLEGRGHRILRQALEKMLRTLPGQQFGRPIGETVEFEIEFSFE